MNSYKLIIAYSGTQYHGWQEQKGVATVAGTLQNVFKKVFNHDIKLVAASRTDAGVHALGQVAIFRTELSLDPHNLMHAWNARLPADILIRSAIQYEPQDFHSQRNVKEKTYYYHFFTKRPLPMVAPYGLFYHKKLDVEKLKACLTLFVGTHDFRSFCSGDDHESTVSTINSIQYVYFKKYGVHRIVIKGPRFLRYMIRRIVGASLAVASSSQPVEHIHYILKQKNPLHSLPTAAAHGLLLRNITYQT